MDIDKEQQNFVHNESECYSLSSINIPKYAPLHFLQANVTVGPKTKPITLQALFDTGANATFMSMDAYRRMDPTGHYPLIKSTAGKVKVADNKTSLPVRGNVKITFILQTDAGCQLSFQTQAIVIDNLQHDLYLGNAIQQNEMFLSADNTGISFQDEGFDHASRCDLEVKHKISFNVQKPKAKQIQKLTCLKDNVVTPGQYGYVVVAYAEGTPEEPTDILVGPQNCQVFGLYIPEQVIRLSKADDHAFLLVGNETTQEIFFEANSLIAEVEEIKSCELQGFSIAFAGGEADHIDFNDDEIGLSLFSAAVPDDSKPLEDCITISSLQVADKLPTDRLEAQGYAQVPVSQVTKDLDEARSLCLRRFPNRATDEQIFDLMHTDGLSDWQKNIVKKLVACHRPVFAADMYELSCTDLVHLDYKARDNVSLADMHVNYTPIPEADKPEAREILRQMQQAGIISPLKQNVTIISNLLTRRKKSGKLRIILDNRMANAFSTKIQDLGSHPLVITTTALKHAIAVTTTDFSNSYFQIPTTPRLAGILAFRGADRDLYQMNRAAQGYINSGGALNTAVYLSKTIPMVTGDLCGFIPLKYYKLTPITEENVHTLEVDIPHVHIGNADDTNTYTTGRRVTRFSREELLKQSIVTPPANCGSVSYVDDLILYSPKYREKRVTFNETPEFIPSVQPLITDIMKKTKEAGFPETTVDYVPISSRSGMRVTTGTCENVTRHNTSLHKDPESFFQHMALVDFSWGQLEKCRLTISPEKTFVATNKIEFLGYVWTPGELSVEKIRLAAFDNLRIHNQRSLQAALGSIAYHRMQIPIFSHLAQPLYELIRQPKFKWEPHHDAAWKSIKYQLRLHATVHTYDPEKPVVLSTDASYHACSAHLYQKCGEHARLVVCASRSFTKAELSRSIIRKEVDAVTYATQIFSPFLYGAKDITLEIDSRAILFVLWCRDSTPFFTRLSGQLSQLGITKIIHCPSKLHEPADSLSRDTAEKFKFSTLADERQYDSKLINKLLSVIDIPPGTVFDSTNPDTLNPLVSMRKNLFQILMGNFPEKVTKNTVIRESANYTPAVARERKIRPPYTMPLSAVSPKSPFMLSKRYKQNIKNKSRQKKAAAAEVRKAIPSDLPTLQLPKKRDRSASREKETKKQSKTN